MSADTQGLERPLEILPLAARSEGALRVLAERYVERLSPGPADDWRDLCHTAAVGRVAFPHRLSVRGADPAAIRLGLTAFLAGQPNAGVVRGAASQAGARASACCSPVRGRNTPAWARRCMPTRLASGG